jgi:hypothetical protein
MNRNELLKDMADKLNVKSSFLSAVELGKKNVPSLWENQITELYELDKNQSMELREAILESAQFIKLDLQNRSAKDRSLVLAFARSFDSFSDEKKESLKKLIM